MAQQRSDEDDATNETDHDAAKSKRIEELQRQIDDLVAERERLKGGLQK